MPRPLFAATICALAGCVGDPTPDPLAVGALDFAGHGPSNLVIIGVDTLRRDAVGRYGGASPSVDWLLAGGVALDDHRSCSNWTLSAIFCFATGRSQIESGFSPSELEPLPSAIPALPDALSAAGFSTALVSANTFVGQGSGYSVRFDAFTQASPPDAEAVNAGAIEAARELLAGGDRWLLQVHYLDPHNPYEVPVTWGAPAVEDIGYDLSVGAGYEALAADWPEMSEAERAAVQEHLGAVYQAEVDYVDAAIGRLVSELDALGALDDALVLLWSDHGEQFFEHGDYWHGRSLFAEESLAVAGLWTLPTDRGGPGLVPTAWVGPTTLADLYDSALAALQVDGVTDGVGQAVGTAPADRALSSLRYHAANLDQTTHVMEQGGWRLHYRWSGESQLYDLSTDPEEAIDRFAEGDPTASALWELLEPQVLELAEQKGVDLSL